MSASIELGFFLAGFLFGGYEKAWHSCRSDCGELRLYRGCTVFSNILSSRACCDRTRGNGFSLKGEIQTTYKEEIFYDACGETLVQVALEVLILGHLHIA